MDGVKRTECGILLIMDGTRSDVGQAQSEYFVSMLKQRLGQATPIAIAYLRVQKPNLPMAFRMIDNWEVQRWLCVPLFVFSADHLKFTQEIKKAARYMSRHSDLELLWMNQWGAESQLISLVAGVISRMMLEYVDKPRILLVGGQCNNTKAFQNYVESAQRISRLVGEAIEPCVLAGVGPTVQRILDYPLGSFDSLLIVPYVSFEGLLLQNLRHVLRSAPHSRRRKQIEQVDALFTLASIAHYVSIAIEGRLQQEGMRNRIAGYAYA